MFRLVYRVPCSYCTYLLILGRVNYGSSIVGLLRFFVLFVRFAGVLCVLLGRAAEHARPARSRRDRPGIELDPPRPSELEAISFRRTLELDCLFCTRFLSFIFRARGSSVDAGEKCVQTRGPSCIYARVQLRAFVIGFGHDRVLVKRAQRATLL